MTNVNFEVAIEEEENLLLPEQIELADFKESIETVLDKEELDLFKKWYKLNKSSHNSNNNAYKLKINFLKTQNQNELEHELKILLEAFLAKLDEELKLKYLKTIQQEEIELILNHVNDPTSIIWFHLNKNNPNDGLLEDESSPVTELIKNLNRQRYSKILDLLESQVLAHNYKSLELENNIKNEQISKQHIQTMNDFLCQSIKLILDTIKSEYGKSLSSSVTAESAFKIDKNLANEIFKH